MFRQSCNIGKGDGELKRVESEGKGKGRRFPWKEREHARTLAATTSTTSHKALRFTILYSSIANPLYRHHVPPPRRPSARQARHCPPRYHPLFCDQRMPMYASNGTPEQRRADQYSRRLTRAQPPLVTLRLARSPADCSLSTVSASS